MASRQSLSRRAVSTNSPPLQPDINHNVNPDFLLTFVLKLAIVNYRSEPRFRVSDTINTQMESLTVSPSSRRSSYVALSSASTTGSPASSDKSKQSKSELPKNMVKLLSDKLVKLLTVSSSKYIPDATSRIVFARFYTSFKGQVAETITSSRSPFDLLMVFLSETKKELNSPRLADGDPSSRDPNIYGERFIDLLVDILNEKGYTSSHASLIEILHGLKSSLSKRETVKPTVTPAMRVNGGHGAKNSISGNLSTDNSIKPTFKLSDMDTAIFLCQLFNYSHEQMQQMVHSLKGVATSESAVSELKFFKNELEVYNRHPSYTREDFSSDASFNSWKAYELSQIDSHLQSFYKVKPSLQDIEPFRPVPGEPINFIYTPPDPKSFYRLLVIKCLEFDHGNSSNLVLSNKSANLLLKVSNSWRLTSITRPLLLLNASVELYFISVYTLDKLRDDVFELVRHQITDNGRDLFDPQAWPECDKALSYATMSQLFSSVVDQITTQLEGILDAKRPDINSLLGFMGNEIIPYTMFDGYPPLDPSSSQISAIKNLIIRVAEDNYQEQVEKIPRDESFAMEHILQVADVLLSNSTLIQKRYKKPLFGMVNIAEIVISSYFKAFSEDSNLMVQHYFATLKARNLEPPFPSVKELYSKLVLARHFYKSYIGGDFSFNIEARLKPYALKSVQESSVMASSWLEKIVASDDFLPIKVVDEDDIGNVATAEENNQSLTSSSVSDLFASFDGILKMVKSLEWENDVHLATFYTIAMKVR